MRRTIIFLIMLLLAVGVYAVDVGGSTAVGGMQGEDYMKVELDQGAFIEVGPVRFDGNVGYDIDMELEEKFWEYDLAAKYSVAGFVFGTKIYGEKELELRKNKSWVDFAYENIALNAMACILLDPEQEDFQGAEFSAVYTFGPAVFTVGYLLTDVGAEIAEVAPDEPLNGGVYAKVKVDY